MRSSARNLVNSVSPIGSGSSTRLTARRSSVGVTRTGEFTLRWRLPGALRSRSSPLLRCDAAGGRPEAAVLSSRPGHARRPNRSASKSAPLRCWLMLGSMLWTTRPEHRLPLSVARASASPLPLVELVRGEIDAFLVERYHIWDHAPWILLVEEAGGRFTDRTGGHAGDQGGGLYSNANLHSQLLTALQYPRRPRPPGPSDLRR